MSDAKTASRVLPIAGAFLAGLVLVLGVFIYLASHSASPIGRAVASVGGPFHLEDQTGKPFTDQDMKGRPFLVFFGYTHCPDVCPTTLLEISDVMKALGKDADRTGALFVTVDPERDTPAVLKDYLSNFDPHLRALTGDPAAVEAALKAYRVYAAKVRLKDGHDTMDHTAAVYLLDKDGRFVSTFTLKQPPEAAAGQLRGYL
ncbi:MAG: SCO family protein [Xanthobacteraceae bacterium]